ncbi:hypothetical protein EI94DRAFT_1704917 [Lactarius quietus]|nr:hypothetical protein EI94DRAFT_1704917 [Lactarius quietus]
MVTNFDFMIEHQISFCTTQWIVRDDEPTYRGCMSKEVGPPGQMVKADYDTINSFRTWVRERRLHGLPPWVTKKRRPANSLVGTAEQAPLVGVSQSSWMLRQGADDYC